MVVGVKIMHTARIRSQKSRPNNPPPPAPLPPPPPPPPCDEDAAAPLLFFKAWFTFTADPTDPFAGTPRLRIGRGGGRRDEGGGGSSERTNEKGEKKAQEA